MMVVVANLRLGGFFERLAESIVQRLHPHHLLPTVILLCGVLSAFLVNDIVCLVMTPFVLHMARRLGMPPVPYLVAVATSSNIGSVATITGNPQNMLIGSLSGISYLDFTARLGPIAAAGLLLNWALITGSIANIIVVERAAAEGVQIGFGEFLRIGVPVTVATLACGAGWLWMTG